jgi:hypothetical protein
MQTYKLSNPLSDPDIICDHKGRLLKEIYIIIPYE